MLKAEYESPVAITSMTFSSSGGKAAIWAGLARSATTPPLTYFCCWMQPPLAFAMKSHRAQLSSLHLFRFVLSAQFEARRSHASRRDL
jgi:hypothetical protein